jgi:Ca-activated chloride channel family protein
MTPARWLLLAGTTVPLIYGAGAVRIEQQLALSRSEFPQLSTPTVPKLIAQQRPARPVPSPALTPVADQAVVINVEVFEPLGRYVTGLEGTNFRVFEDDVEQTITGFSSALTPISLGVVVNVHSGALQNPQQTNVEFSRELLPEDELFVSYPVGPGLPLFDAVYNAMTQLERAKNQRKILYVVSDQADLASRYTAAGLSQALKDSAVQVFAAVGTDQPDGATLREIAEATGGRYFVGIFSPDGRFLAELNDGRRELGSLGSIFRIGGLGAARVGSYTLTYTPTNPARDGGFRRIRVGVTGVGLPPLTARTRSGYFAPTR